MNNVQTVRWMICCCQMWKPDLPVDVSSSLSQPLHAARVSSKRCGVRRRLFEAAGHCVHPTTRLHETHDTFQLCAQKQVQNDWKHLYGWAKNPANHHEATATLLKDTAWTPPSVYWLTFNRSNHHYEDDVWRPCKHNLLCLLQLQLAMLTN